MPLQPKLPKPAREPRRWHLLWRSRFSGAIRTRQGSDDPDTGLFCCSAFLLFCCSAVRPTRTSEIESPNLMLARLRPSSAVSAETQSVGPDWGVKLVPPQGVGLDRPRVRSQPPARCPCSDQFPHLFPLRSQFSAPYASPQQKRIVPADRQGACRCTEIAL